MAFPCVFKIFSYVATFMLGSPLLKGFSGNENDILATVSYVLATSLIGVITMKRKIESISR
jgi:hypothetical protein